MNDGWRELSANEAEVIRKMTSKVSSQFTYEPKKYIGKLIDEFGSLALRRREEAEDPVLANVMPLVSAYFDDDNNKDTMGPFVHLIIFWDGSLLRELQIYRDDGGIVRKEILADDLFEITPEG